MPASYSKDLRWRVKLPILPCGLGWYDVPFFLYNVFGNSCIHKPAVTKLLSQFWSWRHNHLPGLLSLLDNALTFSWIWTWVISLHQERCCSIIWRKIYTPGVLNWQRSHEKKRILYYKNASRSNSKKTWLETLKRTSPTLQNSINIEMVTTELCNLSFSRNILLGALSPLLLKPLNEIVQEERIDVFNWRKILLLFNKWLLQRKGEHQKSRRKRLKISSLTFTQLLNISELFHRQANWY
mgnify:CR=1 FL=1